MLHSVAFAIWFMLPAALANVTPIFASRLPFLKKFNQPIDNHRTFHGQPIFGPHKTWRGFITGIAVAVLTVYVESVLWSLPALRNFVVGNIDYSTVPFVLYGFLLGFGALGGDAVESFFKRRLRIASGKSWLLFDQVDYVLGAIIATLPLGIFNWEVYLFIIVIFVVVHLIASYLGWLLGLKHEPI